MKYLSRTLLSIVVVLLVGSTFGRSFDDLVHPKLVVLPGSVHQNATFTGTVILDNTASSDTVVNLSSSGASVPSTVTVTQGNDRATFSVTAGASTSGSVTASANGSQAQGNFSITNNEY